MIICIQNGNVINNKHNIALFDSSLLLTLINSRQSLATRYIIVFVWYTQTRGFLHKCKLCQSHDEASSKNNNTPATQSYILQSEYWYSNFLILKNDFWWYKSSFHVRMHTFSHTRTQVQVFLFYQINITIKQTQLIYMTKQE